MKKFRMDFWTQIDELEVVKETEKQVTFKTENGLLRREPKQGVWHGWHDTFEQAKEALIAINRAEIEKYKLGIEKCEENIERLQKTKYIAIDQRVSG